MGLFHFLKVKKCGFDKKINVVFQDALEVNLSGVAYDLIFIDAAKGQYTKFFEKFKYFLKKDGTIITDNLSFHGLVEDESLAVTKNQKGLEISEKSCHKIRKCISEGERCYFASAHQIAFEGVGIMYEVW